MASRFDFAASQVEVETENNKQMIIARKQRD